MRFVAAVLTWNVADLAPAATTTLDGTAASDEFELMSATTVPPLPAGPVSVTVPVSGTPPTTLALPSVNCESDEAAAGITVNVVVFVAP